MNKEILKKLTKIKSFEPLDSDNGSLHCNKHGANNFSVHVFCNHAFIYCMKCLEGKKKLGKPKLVIKYGPNLQARKLMSGYNKSLKNNTLGWKFASLSTKK